MDVKYEVNIPRALYLALLVSENVVKSNYYNTSDLEKWANEKIPELIRTRKDKDEYNFLDDTKHGGLRGNFSTLLAFKGIIRKNNTFTAYYGIGKNNRLFNAYIKGEIILDSHKYCAYTQNKDLKRILEQEKLRRAIKEGQSHVKIALNRNKELGIIRDNSFGKESVIKTPNNQFFLRVIFNSFVNEETIEYSLYNYLSGKKIKRINIHPMFAIPSKGNYWSKIFILDSKEILKNTPLFIFYNKKKEKFYDEEGHIYKHYTLTEASKMLSDCNGCVDERLNYDWNIVQEEFTNKKAIEVLNTSSDELFIFIEHFLKWKNEFILFNKKTKIIDVSSSGGADVILETYDGKKQKLELEHKWKNYIQHKHYNSVAWKDAWIFADEPFDFGLINKIFSPFIKKYLNFIPKVFLCTNSITKEKEAYEVDWKTHSYRKLDIE